jgi:hypothetical protein
MIEDSQAGVNHVSTHLKDGKTLRCGNGAELHEVRTDGLLSRRTREGVMACTVGLKPSDSLLRLTLECFCE